MSTEPITTPDADQPDWAIRIEAKLDNIEKVHSQILAVVNELKPEVLSVVEGLKKNPMFKMLLGGK